MAKKPLLLSSSSSSSSSSSQPQLSSSNDVAEEDDADVPVKTNRNKKKITTTVSNVKGREEEENSDESQQQQQLPSSSPNHKNNNNTMSRNSTSASSTVVLDSLQGSLPSTTPLPPATTTTTTSTSTTTTTTTSSNAALTQLSRYLKWYTTFMSRAGNQEIGLKFLQYTLWLVAKVLQTSYRSSSSSNNKNSTVKLQRVVAFCSKLSTDLSFARYMTRLFGWPTALEAAWHNSWAVDSSSIYQGDDKLLINMDRHRRVDAWLGRILAYSMVFYYPAEHVAFLHWMAPPAPAPPASSSAVCKVHPPTTRTAERYSAWSCRAWSVYILAEVVQCILQWRKQRQEQQRLLEQQQRLLEQQQQQQQQQQQLQLLPDSGGTDDDSTTTPSITALVTVESKLHDTQRAMRNVELQLLRNALFVLPTIHWSLPNWDVDPWLPAPLVNTLMWLESLVHFYKVTRCC
jgi:hypothetical protein